MPKKPGDIIISREQQNAVQEMQTAVMNKLTLGFNNYPETQKLFNRLGYASNFANAISADDAYDIEDNMDKLQQDGGLIAALTQPVPWGDGSTSFYALGALPRFRENRSYRGDRRSASRL